MKKKWIHTIALILTMSLLVNTFNRTEFFSQGKTAWNASEETNMSEQTIATVSNMTVSENVLTKNRVEESTNVEGAGIINNEKETVESENPQNKEVVPDDGQIQTDVGLEEETTKQKEEINEQKEETKEQKEETKEQKKESSEVAKLDDVTNEEETVETLENASQNDVRNTQLTIPSTLDEYKSLLDAGQKLFYISDEQDFRDVQELCKLEEVDGFSGIEFIISSPTGSNEWNISGITDFNGIGTADYPFKGTLHNYLTIGAGVKFRFAEPLFTYLGEGAYIYNLDIINVQGENSCAVLAENITGTVKISDIVISGEVVGSETKPAGTIASNLLADSRTTLTNVKSTANVSGSIAGGIAGTIGNNATITMDENSAIGTGETPITVTGSTAAGGYYGSITGNCTWDLTYEQSIFTSVKGSGSGYYGEFAGQFIGDTINNTQLTISNGTNIKVNVSGTGSGGGLIGLCTNKTGINVLNGTLVLEGSVESTDGASGGVVGELINAQIEFVNFQIDASISGVYAGGIAGRVKGGKCIIDTPVVNRVMGTQEVGGLIGNVTDSAAIELQGKITVKQTPTGEGIRGLIVGSQDKSLIYLSETEGKIVDGVSQLSVPAASELEEIGTYGGLYRNQMIDNKILIGDGTLNKVGAINNTITKNGDSYQLNHVADFECLTIVLGSEGAFAKEAFGGATPATLLAGSYEVNNSVDISYEKTGIITLNRNDKEDEVYAFCGVMQGKDTSITITQNSSVKQQRVGLFSTLTGNATFTNLCMEGTTGNAEGAGGIAYQSIGIGLTLNHITIKKEFSNNTGHIGGVLAKENGTASPFNLTANTITLASVMDADTNADYSGFITELSDADIFMQDVKLGGKLTSISESNVGGFLGKNWLSIAGKIQDVSVAEATEYTSGGQFGTLLNKATGQSVNRLILENVTLENLTVNANSTKEQCALLIQNGVELVLEVIDYDTTGCIVNNPGTNFDEVVGHTRESGFVKETGIVSLHKSGTHYPEYHYENKVESLQGKSNAMTLYFYDVFQHLEDESGNVKVTLDNSSDSPIVLDTPEAVLLWDLAHIAGDCRSYFWNRHFTTNSDTNIYGNSYIFKGELDLSEISFYPVPKVEGGTYCGEDATITFDSKKWDTLKNTDSTCQHYGLQSGLFLDPKNIRVENLTLSGEVANQKDAGGALVMGMEGLTGGGSFTNVVLKDLFISGYTDEATGLLISKIPGGLVTFDEIKMDYTTKNSPTKAAAALIGSAGGEDAKDLILNFAHMQIADDKEDRADGMTHNGNILKYASFLYNYDYTDDAALNKGSGLYLFSEADKAVENVTYGAELDYTTEFSDTENKVFRVDTDAVPGTLYKPYVYKVKQIEVNPKPGHILKGCGTYEDPYIIENYKQFLTLYRYMNETGTEGNYQYQTFYMNWKMNKMGDDSTFCANKHNVVWEPFLGSFAGTGKEDARTFGEDGFPTPDELSRAYYQLGADIDLTMEMGSTYEKITKDFVGFGTKERPFVGVFYGKDTSGNVHSVTMPDKLSDALYETYGFIQYAKGAVVKDLTLKTSMAGNGNNSSHWGKAARISGSGGMAIAVILGGDNIIDNVTVEGELAFNPSSPATSHIGGFVGNVKKGGLILRNISDTALSKFDFARVNAPTNKAWGVIAGIVEDGYVVYEGDADDAGSADSYICEKVFGWEQWSTIVQIPNYSMLNADKLKSAVTNIANPLTVSKNDKNITISIPNAAALQIMSMALNSDSLNVTHSANANYKTCGYTELSRCRKAKYDAVGTADSANLDYIAAVKFDNVMGFSEQSDLAFAYPYLYQYMGINDNSYVDYVKGITQFYSIFNLLDPVNTEVYMTTWQLTGSDVYDMGQTAFGKSFRGIGALYFEKSGAFHGIFDGNNQTILLEMERIVMQGNPSSANKIGLFNTLMGNHQTSLYPTTADFRGVSATTADMKPCYEIRNIKLAGSIEMDSNATSSVVAGGIAGNIRSGNFIFSNITIDSSKSFAIGKTGFGKIQTCGGIIGAINTGSNANVLIDNCWLEGTNENRIYFNSSGTNGNGGLVGENDALIIKVQNSGVKYLQVYSKEGRAGGLIGYAAKLDTTEKMILYGTESAPIKVEDCNIIARVDVGGAIGNSNVAEVANIDIKNTKLCSLNGGSSCGGVIGDGGKGCSIKNVTLANVTSANVDSYIYSARYAGGIIGNIINSYTIDGVESDNCYMAGHYAVGGIVGNCSGGTDTIKNVNVRNMLMKELGGWAKDYSGIGGVVGVTRCGVVIENATVSGTVEEDGTYNSRFRGHTDQTRPEYYHGIGGIVGTVAFNWLTLKNCKADSILLQPTIKKDNTEGNANCKVGGGGLIGCIGTGCDGVKIDGIISSNNMNIDVPLRAEVGQEISAGGGCFGYVGKSILKLNTNTGQYFDGITATNNEISGKQIGGVLGCMQGSGSIRFDAITVKGGKLESDAVAGGIAGRLNPQANVIGHDGSQYNNVVEDMEIIGQHAGGVVGETRLASVLRMSNLCIQNNVIHAKQFHDEEACSAGGVVGKYYAGNQNTICGIYNVTLNGNRIVGRTADDTLSEEEVAGISVGGIIGNIWHETGITKLSTIYSDNIRIHTNNQIGLQAADDEKVKLVQKSGDSYVLSDFKMPTPDGVKKDYDVLSELTEAYGYCVGTVVGTIESALVQMYMLNTLDTNDKFTMPVLESNPPITDVGRKVSQTRDDYREFCHIIYGAKVEEAKSSENNLLDMKTEVESADTVYADTTDAQTLLKKSRFSKELVEMFKETYETSYTYPGTDKSIDFPILVWRAKNGTLQEVLEGISDIMTGMAGASASDMRILNITAESKKCLNSTIKTGESASIEVERNDAGEHTYHFNGYDGITEDGYLTYTELCFNYSWKDEVKHEKIFRIPIFVEEPILYSVHAKMMEGKVSSVDTMKESGISPTDITDKVLMANDSDYTLLLEYTYGKVRKEMSDATVIDKAIYLINADGAKKFAPDTKLLLIDVMDDNKAYYYTVRQGDEKTEIKFSDFKDSAGNQYVNKPINSLETITDEGMAHYTDMEGHQLTDSAVERYLLTVMSEDESDGLYQIHAGISVEDKELAAKMMVEENHEEEVVIDVLALPGLEISLDKASGNTDISGSISKDGGIDVKATIRLEAKDIYWVEKENVQSIPIVDSSNNGKYLELAFYLRDNNENRVRLPAGTNFSYKLVTGDYSEKKVIPDDSLIYYYKDIRNKYERPDFEYLINKVSTNTSVTAEIKLDFAGADLSQITDSSYVGWIELLRTANRDYPMGSGNKLDEYSEVVNASAMKPLGFAIRAKELSQLAINTYPQPNESDVIDFDLMFDFSDLLEETSGAGTAAVTEKWAGYDYEVTYKLYKKTSYGANATYAEYNGTDIVLIANDTESTNGTLITTYNFTATEIENGNIIPETEGVLVFDEQVTIKTKSLTQGLGNLSNYKVEATLKVKEKGTNTETATETKDFFIYTITKLKTDL